MAVFCQSAPPSRALCDIGYIFLSILTTINRRHLMKVSAFLLLGFFFCSTLHGFAQVSTYDGLDSGLNNLYRVSDAKTRSISPENLTGEKGKGGMAKVGNAADAARD